MKIGIVGCAGRMGRMLVGAVLDTPDCEIAGGTEEPKSGAIGQDLGIVTKLGALDLLVGDDAEALFKASDVVVDFTLPVATIAHAGLAAAIGTPLVIGTTGLGADHVKAIKKAAATAPIVHAANMSVGVNLMLGLTEQVAGLLGYDFDIEVVEMHHRHKVDAPSGTALAIGQAAAAGRGVELDSVAQKVRDGHTGPRGVGDIGFATLRGGDVVGEHTIVFAGEGERIEITHKAASRAIFARGAVRAAQWVVGKRPKLYSMRDVLGFH
jgi:4-hydroxy-tetrahydrodipicolinate reductase